LRVYLLETGNAVSDPNEESATIVACNIDDMNPERYEFIMEQLFDAGAADAWLTPIIMKKLRPANQLSVLCSPEKVHAIKGIIFSHSTTIGLREHPIKKSALSRIETAVHTKFGVIMVKQSVFEGRIVRSKPEYDVCKSIAKQNNINIEEVEREVIKNL